jgi:uncharacterized protein YjbI with pentapeptide repeats
MGADLTGADLRGANLCRADLRDQEADEKGPARKTQWIGAKFAGATYDADTKFPAGFDPESLGMKPADAAAERLAS